MKKALQVGDVLGRLTVVDVVKSKKGARAYLRCECGKVISKPASIAPRFRRCGRDCPLGKVNNGQVADGTQLAVVRKSIEKSGKDTDYTGIYLHANGRYYPSIRFRGERISLGGFDTLQEAKEARNQAINEYFKPAVEKNKEVIQLADDSRRERYRGKKKKLQFQMDNIQPGMRLGLLTVQHVQRATTGISVSVRCDCGAEFKCGATRLARIRSCGKHGLRKMTGYINSMVLEGTNLDILVRSLRRRAMGEPVGIYQNPNGKYYPRIVVKQKVISLGGYDTLGEAWLVREQAEEKYYRPLLAEILTERLKKLQKEKASRAD